MKMLKGFTALILTLAVLITVSLSTMAAGGAIIGDATSNKVVDIIDLIRMKKYAANITTDISLDAVDFNYDSTIDSSDMVVIKRILLGDGIEELGINSEYLEDVYVSTVG